MPSCSTILNRLYPHRVHNEFMAKKMGLKELVLPERGSRTKKTKKRKKKKAKGSR